MRVGALDVSILVEGEGSFATVAEVFPALDAPEEWRLPVNAVLIRGAGTTVLVDTGLGPEPLQLVDPDLVYVSDHDSDLAAATRKEVLGRLADRGTDVIASHFHGVGRFARNGEGFSWSSHAKEGDAAVE